MLFLLVIVAFSLQDAVSSSAPSTNAVIGEPTSISINASCCIERIWWEKNKQLIGKWPQDEPNNCTATDVKEYALIIERVEVFHNGLIHVRVQCSNSTLVHYYPNLRVRYPSHSTKQPVGNCSKLETNYCLVPDAKTMTEKLPVRRSTTSSSDYNLHEWYQAPIITKAPPKCIKVWVGQKVELECDFVGFPDSRPRWGQLSGNKRFQKKIDNSNGNIHVLLNPSVRKLVFESIKKTDQNTYVCTGKNLLGTVRLFTQVKVYDYNSFCGTPIKHLKRRDKRRHKRIAGGNSIKPVNWPWQALILVDGLHCGGAVINSRWVITAWHCVLDYELQSTSDPNNITVYVGSYDRSLQHEKSRQVFKVKQIHTPPVNAFTADSDLVLLELCGEIFYSKSVRPLCVANQVPNPETECEVAGWGRTEKGGPFSDSLRIGRVPLVSVYECRKYYDFLSTNVICAGFLSGGDGTCDGDSGSPLVHQRKDRYQWELLGLVSGRSGCDSGYAFFSNAVFHRKWIIDQTGLNDLTVT